MTACILTGGNGTMGSRTKVLLNLGTCLNGKYSYIKILATIKDQIFFGGFLLRFCFGDVELLVVVGYGRGQAMKST